MQKRKKNIKKFDGMFIGKKIPSGDRMDIRDIRGETGNIIIQGKVVSFEIKELRPVFVQKRKDVF